MPTIVASVGTMRRHAGVRPIGTAGMRPYTGRMKMIVIGGLCAVVIALVTAGVFLYRDQGRGNRVWITLAIRVALSASLIAFLVISYKLGWIAPTGVR